MSDCNVNEIMAAAGCYACLTPEQLEVIQTELLCRIYTNGGGGGTPGGLDQQVQFNDAGAFGGDAGLTYDKATNLLTAGEIAISSMTSGSVLFAGAGGLVSQDNANFFWDNTNNRLGIGTNSPNDALQVAGAIRLSTDVAFSASQGPRLYKSASNGFALQGVTGINNDFTFFTPTGTELFSNPTGTTNIILASDGSGKVGVGLASGLSAHFTIKNALAADIGQIIKLAAVPTGDAFRVTSSADAILSVINSSGYLGIGVNPTKLIHTLGTGEAVVLIENNSGAAALNWSGCYIKNNLGNLGLFILTTSANNFNTTVYGTSQMTFEANGAGGMMFNQSNGTAANNVIKFVRSTDASVTIQESMRIDGSGNVKCSNALTVGGTATINQVSKILQGSDTHDFASVAAGTESAVRTVTITGAAAGDPVFIGLPDAASTPNISWTVWVSAANTVSYKFYNRNTVAAVDLGNLTYKFFVHQL